MVNDLGKHDFGILLALGYASFVAELRAHLEQEGFTDLHSSFGYVARALSSSSLTQRELADLLAVTPPAALKIVDQMEGAGYLERRLDPDDARARRLALTKRGRAALAAARAFHAAYEERLVEKHGKQKVAALRALLEGIVDERTRRGAPAVLRPM